MNSHLNTLASKSMLWNTLESICYQMIMCIHQVLLFYAVGTQVYGFAGLLFSAIYTLITIINIGFDTSIGAWWHDALASKKTFQRLVVQQYVPQIALLLPALGLFQYISQIAPSLLCVIGMIIFLESTKRTFKNFLYLEFANNYVAPTEVGTLFLYVCMVWTSIALSGSITVMQLLMPMIVSSGLAVWVYAWHTLQIYRALPDTEPAIKSPTLNSLVKIRTSNYVTQLTHLLFSGNVLIPLFAFRFGLETAGTLKLVNTLAYGFGTLMHKIVGTTSQALFAYTRSSDHAQSKAVFAACTNKIYQLVYLGIIFILINSSKMGASALSAIGIVPALLFATIIITENICTIYEQFLTTRKQGYYNAILQIMSFTITYGLIYQVDSSLSTVLSLLLMIRIMTLILFETIVRYHWNIKSDIRLSPFYGLTAIIVSLLVFLVW